MVVFAPADQSRPRRRPQARLPPTMAPPPPPTQRRPHRPHRPRRPHRPHESAPAAFHPSPPRTRTASQKRIDEQLNQQAESEAGANGKGGKKGKKRGRAGGDDAIDEDAVQAVQKELEDVLQETRYVELLTGKKMADASGKSKKEVWFGVAA